MSLNNLIQNIKDNNFQNQNGPVEILFATTNPGKIERLKRIMNEQNVKIWTLNDLDYEIVEPEETGNNVVENAEIKARYYWEKIKVKMPVLSEDIGTYFRNAEPQDNPYKDIKKPVVEMYGSYNQENMIKYYSDLAKKYGGVLDQVWEYGMSVYDGKNSYKIKAVADNVRLVQTPKYPSYDGFHFSCLCQHEIAGEWKYSSEISKLDLQKYFEEPIRLKTLELMRDSGIIA